MRKTTADVDDIVKNSGIGRSTVERVKNHLFNKPHQLDNGLKRFDADPEIANAWERLRAGTATSADRQLFKHEQAESIYEQLFRTLYRQAHDRVTDRFPSGI